MLAWSCSCLVGVHLGLYTIPQAARISPLVLSTARPSAVGLRVWIIYVLQAGRSFKKPGARANKALKGHFGPDCPPTQTLKFALVGVAAVYVFGLPHRKCLHGRLAWWACALNHNWPGPDDLEACPTISGHTCQGHFWEFGNLLDVRPFHSLIWSTLDCIPCHKRRAASRSLEKKESRERALRPRSSPTQTLNFARYRSQDSRASAAGLRFWILYFKKSEQEQSLERALRPRSSPHANPKVCPRWCGCRLGQVLPVGWITSPQLLAWSCSCVVGLRIELRFAWLGCGWLRLVGSRLE